MSDTTLLLDPQAVKDLKDARGDEVVLLDVRWSLAGGGDRAAYLDAHIPGARFVDLETELSGTAGTGGRHPLPTAEEFEARMRAVGVNENSVVVCYDGEQSTSAARLWWLLEFFGHSDVFVLNGGMTAWLASGFETEGGNAEVVPGSFVALAGSVATLQVDEVLEFGADHLLFDARARERYVGEVEPVDPVAGHIPGAVNAPTTENLVAGGRFHDAHELRARFAALGADTADRIGVYCGSGVTATHEILALRVAGFRAALYPGSWSHWVEDPSRPVAKGE